MPLLEAWRDLEHLKDWHHPDYIGTEIVKINGVEKKVFFTKEKDK